MPPTPQEYREMINEYIEISKKPIKPLPNPFQPNRASDLDQIITILKDSAISVRELLPMNSRLKKLADYGDPYALEFLPSAEEAAIYNHALPILRPIVQSAGNIVTTLLQNSKYDEILRTQFNRALNGPIDTSWAAILILYEKANAWGNQSAKWLHELTDRDRKLGQSTDNRTLPQVAYTIVYMMITLRAGQAQPYLDSLSTKERIEMEQSGEKRAYTYFVLSLS
jgi:hypothetical protein